MNSIILNYLLKKFLKTIFIFVFVFYCFGIILNLFEEVEFFKNLNVSITLPLILTSIYIPSMIIKFFPFIIFLSSMWFMLTIRNNRDLLTLKVFGYSNIKIFFILAITSFILGWLILAALFASRIKRPSTFFLISGFGRVASIDLLMNLICPALVFLHLLRC